MRGFLFFARAFWKIVISHPIIKIVNSGNIRTLGIGHQRALCLISSNVRMQRNRLVSLGAALVRFSMYGIVRVEVEGVDSWA